MSHFNGQHLKALRRSEKISRVDFAEDMSYSEHTIVMWEQETRSPSFDMVVEIARYFNEPIENFVK